MKKTALSLFIAVILFTVGCKSDNQGQPQPLANNSYQPLAKGSTWTYIQKVSNKTYTIDQAVTGATPTFNGKKYFAVDVTTRGLKSETIYYRYSDGIYPLRTTTVGPGSNLPFPIEIPYLKDNAEVGSEWETTVPDSPVPAKIIVKLKGKNENRLVAGTSFTNVMYTEVFVMYDEHQDGDYSIYQIDEFFTAKNVGIIETRNGRRGLSESVTSLISYSLK